MSPAQPCLCAQGRLQAEACYVNTRCSCNSHRLPQSGFTLPDSGTDSGAALLLQG